MARYLTFPAGKRSKFVVAIVFFLVTAVVGGMFSGKFEDAQENETASFLPGKAESVKSLEAVKQYEGGELAYGEGDALRHFRPTNDLARRKCVFAGVLRSFLGRTGYFVGRCGAD